MAGPTSGTTLARPDLGMVAFEYADKRDHYIAEEVLPPLPVDRKKASMSYLRTEDMLKLEDTERNKDGTFNEGEWEFAQLNYATKGHGWQERIDDDEVAEYDPYLGRSIGVAGIASMRCMRVLRRRQEFLVADACTGTTGQATFTSNTTAAAKAWDSFADADPQGDIEGAKEAIADRVGEYPDTLVIPRQAWSNISRCASVREANKYTAPIGKSGKIPLEALAAYFGVERILVGMSRYDTKGPNVTSSLSNIWVETHAMLLLRHEGPSLDYETGLGRLLFWRARGAKDAIFESWREEKRLCDYVRARNYYIAKILFSDCGQLISGIKT